MSRLAKHIQKQNIQRFLFLVVSVGVIMVILFVVGLKSAIGFTIFMNSIFKGSSQNTQSTEKKDFYGTLSVDEPPSATNSAEIQIDGGVTEFDEVEYFINNVSVKKEKIPIGDSFSEVIGKLKPGENKVYVEVSDRESKNKEKSDIYTILYKNEKPKLEIETPKDGDKINKNEITIKGKTDKDVEIQVNGSPVVVGLDGSFTKTYRLSEGDNKLSIVATDLAGNEEKKEMTIKYEKDD
jgi:hypothetical protein